MYPCWVFVEYEWKSAWTSRKTKNTKTSKSQWKIKQSISKHWSFGSMSCLLQGKAEAKLCLGGWDFYLSGMLFCWMPWYFASSNATVRRSHVITFQPLHLRLLHTSRKAPNLDISWIDVSACFFSKIASASSMSLRSKLLEVQRMNDFKEWGFCQSVLGHVQMWSKNAGFGSEEMIKFLQGKILRQGSAGFKKGWLEEHGFGKYL